LADGTVSQKLTQRTDGLAADCENELDKIDQATTNHYKYVPSVGQNHSCDKKKIELLILRLRLVR